MEWKHVLLNPCCAPHFLLSLTSYCHHFLFSLISCCASLPGVITSYCLFLPTVSQFLLSITSCCLILSAIPHFLLSITSCCLTLPFSPNFLLSITSYSPSFLTVPDSLWTPIAPPPLPHNSLYDLYKYRHLAIVYILNTDRLLW